MKKLLFHFVALFWLLVFSGCEKNSILLSAEPPTGRKIELQLKLEPGDIKSLKIEVETNSTIKVKGKTVLMKMDLISEMSLEVIEVSKDGVHLIKAKYLRLSISMDGPVKMKFDSSDVLDLKSPMGKIMGRVIGKTFTVKMSSKGKTLGFFVDESLNPLVKQKIEQSMKNFTIGTTFPEFAVDNGDRWNSSLSQNLNNIELTNNSENTLLKMGDGIATIGISGDIKGAASGKSNGVVDIDIHSGWIKSGKFSSTFVLEKGNQEIETSMSLIVSGDEISKEISKTLPGAFIEEKAKKLQTTGIFRINKKGVLVFTDDANGKTYHCFNKGVKEKVAGLIDRKVKLDARFRNRNGAKITFMTYIVSVKVIKD